MLKRLFWVFTGVGFGFGMSFWVTRMVRRKVARISPDNVAAGLSQAVRELGRDIRAAVSEGTEAMREREAELRSQVESSPSA